MSGRDVNIVLGAQDKAAKVLDNVAKGARQLGNTVRQESKSAAEANKKLESSFQAIKNAAGPLLAVFAAVKTVTAGFSFVSGAADAFDVQQEAVRSLTKALELNGNASAAVIESHKQFASELQSATNVGDEVTLGLMRQASMMGVADDQLQQVTKAAIGLSEATGASLEDSLRKVNQAINGNASALGEFLPAIRQAKTEEERLAIVLDAAGKGLEQKADKATTAAGTAQRLANSWGDFKEVIGQALEPVRKLINTGLAVLVETIQTAVIPAINAIMPSGEQLAAMMEMVRTAVIKAVTFIEVVITNLADVWAVVAGSVQLQVVRIIESVKHGFTVVIPAFLKWFADNFVNMILDAFNAVVTVVKNAATNIANVFGALWENIRSGFRDGFTGAVEDMVNAASKSLLDGFEAKTEALPKIMARQITQGEKDLEASIQTSANNLADAFNEKLAARLGVGEANSDLFGISGLLAGLGQQNQTTGGNGASEQIAATESRLLTRGRTEGREAQMVQLLERIDRGVTRTAENTEPQESLSSDSLSVEIVG